MLGLSAVFNNLDDIQLSVEQADWALQAMKSNWISTASSCFDSEINLHNTSRIF